MKRLNRVNESILGLSDSSTDSNRFYSILLDARAANISESMYDIADKLLVSEKDNAKLALEQLWILKKNILGDETTSTVDMLIEYYQEKMDVLRSKEERIKNVSKDSRSLLEEKHKSDEEIASVKQQINDCTRDLNELTAKLDALKIREQELSLIEDQLKKELNGNENEIVNGLYEIIITQSSSPELPAPSIDKNRALAVVPTEQPVEKPVPQEVLNSEVVLRENEDTSLPNRTSDSSQDEKFQETPPFPKSVVKTTNGSVIGEYFYDGTTYKNKRHYILNSRFFSEKLGKAIKSIRSKNDQASYAELLQMIQDAYKRITENPKIHVEVSTNEILNLKTLKQLWQDVKLKSFDEAERFASRLNAKIEILNSNYVSMLQEQMQRCVLEE